MGARRCQLKIPPAQARGQPLRRLDASGIEGQDVRPFEPPLHEGEQTVVRTCFPSGDQMSGWGSDVSADTRIGSVPATSIDVHRRGVRRMIEPLEGDLRAVGRPCRAGLVDAIRRVGQLVLMCAVGIHEPEVLGARVTGGEEKTAAVWGPRRHRLKVEAGDVRGQLPQAGAIRIDQIDAAVVVRPTPLKAIVPPVGDQVGVEGSSVSSTI